MKDLKEMSHCPRTDLPRMDVGCLHCTYSVKLGSAWFCAYGKLEVR